MNATPKKLRDGSWGALVKSERVNTGDAITVTTRAGKSWDAVVQKVIWTGKGVSICATSKSEGNRGTKVRVARERATCGYPCPVTGRRCTPDDPCHDCM